MENKITQTDEEIRNHLSLQIRFLIKSCQEFDNGDHSEAIRMSTILRTLLKDGNNSVSLISQTIKPSLFNSYYFEPSVNQPKPGNKVSVTQRNFITCTVTGNPYHDFSPNFANEIPFRRIPFQDWWDQIVCKDVNDNGFSRRLLILSCAENDGGAHVDPKLGTNYYNLTRKNSQGMVKGRKQYINGSPIFPQNIQANEVSPLKYTVWHTIRQIAHEVIETLGFEMGYDPKPYYNQYPGLKIFSQAIEYKPTKVI